MPSKEKKLKNTYAVIGRFIVKSSVLLKGKSIIIKPSHAYVKQIRLMKASLPTQAIRNLMKVSRVFSDVIIDTECIKEVMGRVIRRERKDIEDLFKDVEGNIYEVVIIDKKLNYLRLLMPQSEYLKLRNFINKVR